ncbi:Cytoplasmic dynein 2 heavy chain 1 like [Actinidia chinensis var. chinensis]|uniref:Cytoplasmic dynein 2 heavy chain 1 like n=1 Tax=Actinidia chinensis var. chinensis TaxID=1590841 RepID=A0A2R6Q1K2_ACTCC|nr:Cytoplasmic dynein 2 heavy chain 1 like [Actinidia chinensis var. chinensis]
MRTDASATLALPATSATATSVLPWMAQPEVSQPISIILDDSNYRLWSSAMQCFLRARKLWKYITGDAQPPHFSETNDDDDDTLHIQYQTQLEDWDSVNSKIITWFSNTSVSSIHSLFTPFETAKEFEPTWTCPTDAAAFYAYRDRSRLRHFLMALPPDYEHIRASLLHRHPLPTVGQALAELRSEETSKKTMVYQHSQPILATPVWAPLQPPSQSVRVPSPKNMTSGSQKKYCSFCRRDTHSYEDCRSRSKPKRKGYHNRQTAAITDSSAPSPDSSSSTLTAADVETIVTQVLSRTNLHSSALSTTSGVTLLLIILQGLVRPSRLHTK